MLNVDFDIWCRYRTESSRIDCIVIAMLQWPWEQAQMYEVYLRHQRNIMVLTFPDLPVLPWTSKKNPRSQYPTDAVEPYCFCHWPGAGCFLTHHCASLKQKQRMGAEYALPREDVRIDVIAL